MLTKKVKRAKIAYFARLVKEFEKWAKEDAWKGSYDPDDRYAIEDNFDWAKQALLNYFSKHLK